MPRYKIYDTKGKYWKTTTLSAKDARDSRKRFPRARFVLAG